MTSYVSSTTPGVPAQPKPQTTSRGFDLHDFHDLYGHSCSLQKSSLASEDAIWLGVNDPNPRILHGDAKRLGVETDATCGWVDYPLPDEVLCTTRMHLSQQQVKELLPFLQRFAESGSLYHRD
jgi:hypothetical protein